jgi:alginate O-acetyltransferase complex protein AlgI
MVFASFEFLFKFLPIVIILYFILGKFFTIKSQHLFLVLASLFFYGYFNVSYLWIILISIIVNYSISNFIEENKNYRKPIFILGLIFNLGLLGYFKYFNFFIDNINMIFKGSILVPSILLPLGISFFTFQQISFLIDIYRGKSLKYDFLSYCLFVTFFPQLVAGPIVLPNEMLPQFHDKANGNLNYKNLNKGLYLLAIGLAKKIIIADSIATFADVGFDTMTSLTMFEAWLTSLSYTMQLYFDFSGYCDIAMGVGLMFNIKLPQNFNSPYKSTNIRDFWRRWHITLGRFLTNYIYIPLGGSRVGEGKTLRNLLIIFIISGIWHGAGWNFILWGLLHGIAIVIHRTWCNKGYSMNKFIGWILTFNLVNILWVFFRATTFNDAIKIITSMFNFKTMFLMLSAQFRTSTVTLFGNPVTALFLLIAMGIAFLLPNPYEKKDFKPTLLTIIKTAVLLGLSIMFLGENSAFLYFNF